ncbi:50S ribosomal protein L24 [Candidatus Saccharibacteria bacterium]|nr:50S ribosomal protein L24 [Candidatus Saccharibacteria bacterium]
MKTNDKVKVIAGAHKGHEGKILSVNRKTNRAAVEGLPTITRNLKRSRFNPMGGKKELKTTIDLSNLKLIEKKTEKK